VGRVTYAAGGSKNLPLVVWYPIDKGSSAAPAPYNPTIAGRLLDSQSDPMEQNLASVQDHTIAGAGISDARRNFPVIVFWPGYGWLPSRYAILAEELASNGYVVTGISPDYTSGSLADTISARQLVERWAAQMVAVVTRLDSLNASANPPLAGRMDLKRVGLFGHSTGGAVSIQACSVSCCEYILIRATEKK
jgi:predicted dienelactone hydrolase